MSWLQRLQKSKTVPAVVQPEAEQLLGKTIAQAANDAQAPALLSDGCWPHGQAWNAVEIDRFNGRVVAFTGRGVGLAQSEALAEKLVLRDRDGDDRRLCLECRHLASNGRCVADGRGLIAGASVRLEPVPTILQRCEGFRA